jgi:hypothetical protein
MLIVGTDPGVQGDSHNCLTGKMAFEMLLAVSSARASARDLHSSGITLRSNRSSMAHRLPVSKDKQR